MSLLLIIFVLTNHNQDYHVLYFSHQSRVNSVSNQAQLTARPTRRPRAHSDRHDQEPLHWPYYITLINNVFIQRRPPARSQPLKLVVLPRNLKMKKMKNKLHHPHRGIEMRSSVSFLLSVSSEVSIIKRQRQSG